MRPLPPSARALRIASLKLALKHDAVAEALFAKTKDAVVGAVLSKVPTKASLPALLREIDAAIDAAQETQLAGIEGALREVARFKSDHAARP